MCSVRINPVSTANRLAPLPSSYPQHQTPTFVRRTPSTRTALRSADLAQCSRLSETVGISLIYFIHRITPAPLTSLFSRQQKHRSKLLLVHYLFTRTTSFSSWSHALYANLPVNLQFRHIFSLHQRHRVVSRLPRCALSTPLSHTSLVFSRLSWTMLHWWNLSPRRCQACWSAAGDIFHSFVTHSKTHSPSYRPHISRVRTCSFSASCTIRPLTTTQQIGSAPDASQTFLLTYYEQMDIKKKRVGHQFRQHFWRQW